MAIALIAILLGVALYLGNRWSAANAENVELLARIAALKRQLARRR
ncbi:MAG: hypothetical protein ACREVV_02730 [Steroidobacteraceae bacterium]